MFFLRKTKIISIFHSSFISLMDFENYWEGPEVNDWVSEGIYDLGKVDQQPVGGLSKIMPTYIPIKSGDR